MIIIKSPQQNQAAKGIRHEGVRVGEIVAYRAWRVIPPNWFRKASARLHSIFVYDYAWDTDAPAWGDVRSHGIYSFRDQIRSRRDYGYRFVLVGPLLFGTVKIWGEVVEHEAGYRSEFAKIVSLDYGDPRLLEKFREIYRLAPVREGGSQSCESTGQH